MLLCRGMLSDASRVCTTAKQLCRQPYTVTPHAAQVSNFTLIADKACLEATHASVLQDSTSRLHSTSTTDCLTKASSCAGSHIALPLMLLKSANFTFIAVKHAISTCKCLASTAQVCCTALSPLLCLTRASSCAGSHIALPLMLLKSAQT